MNDRIQGLGEIALRVNDLEAMQRFYAEIIGLELMKRFPRAAFFRIAPGVAGHTQILALFDRSGSDTFTPPQAARTSVDHIAFAVALPDFHAERTRLEALNIPLTFAEHEWVHWRSLYLKDPEGNTIELVCYDESIT